MLNQVKATKSHCADLAKHLSPADMQEIKQHGYEPKDLTELGERLWDNCNNSTEAYAIVNSKSGVTYAIGGYCEDGVVWFLCSNYVSNFTKEQRKALRTQLESNRDMALRLYPVLFNYIWKGNPQHIAFTKSCGARFMATKDTHPFVKFEFHRKDFPHLN